MEHTVTTIPCQRRYLLIIMTPCQVGLLTNTDTLSTTVSSYNNDTMSGRSVYIYRYNIM